jgi:hypothetical protein
MPIGRSAKFASHATSLLRSYRRPADLLTSLVQRHRDKNRLAEFDADRLDDHGSPLTLHLETDIMFAVRAVGQPTEGLDRNERLKPLRGSELARMSHPRRAMAVTG